jgi:hypothetical protein
MRYPLAMANKLDHHLRRLPELRTKFDAEANDRSYDAVSDLPPKSLAQELLEALDVAIASIEKRTTTLDGPGRRRLPEPLPYSGGSLT